MAKKQMSCGHNFWVACSGWRKNFKENHRTHTIPNDVDEHLLLKLFSGQSLTENDSKDKLPCSCLVHPHT
ncbi:hypothetical protein B0H10DRAFT_599710 [Mycena sp. CBHHK59/15]|nr:hypothetical protein B0H10DRAFT_599710 [Mycena sp. CBHHK59/15]